MEGPYTYDIETLKDACIVYECKGWASKNSIWIINKFGVERKYENTPQGITKCVNEIMYGFWLEAPKKEIKNDTRETGEKTP